MWVSVALLRLCVFLLLDPSQPKRVFSQDQDAASAASAEGGSDGADGSHFPDPLLLQFQINTNKVLSLFNSTLNSLTPPAAARPSKLIHKPLSSFQQLYSSSSSFSSSGSSSTSHHSKDSAEQLLRDSSADEEDADEYGSNPLETRKWEEGGGDPVGGVNESAIDLLSLIDDLKDWEAPPNFKLRFPYYLAGYDDQDRPVWIAEMGKYGLRETMEEGPESVLTLKKYAKQAAYRIIQSLEEQSTPEREVSKAIFIIDFDGLTLNKMGHAPSILFALNLSRSYKDLILHRLHETIVINANYFAELFIKMVRPVLGRVMDKTTVYGTERKRWTAVLSQLLPPETIPSWYGGYPNYKPVKIYG